MQTLVVVNPASRGGRTGRAWAIMQDTVLARLGPCEVHLTHGPHEATRIVRQALRSGVRRVISVGGDGTHHEVTNGFFDPETQRPLAPDAVLGLLSSGTGSDLVRSFGLGESLEADLERLVASPGVPIDVIACTATTEQGERKAISINIASVGQAGDLVQTVNRGFKGIGGGFPFVAYGVVRAFRIAPWDVELQVDDGAPETRRMRNLAICNGRYQGGGMNPAPQAKLDDGQLDLVSIGDLGPIRSIRAGLASYSGRMHLHAGIWTGTARTLTLTPMPSQMPMLVEADGELLGHAPATFRVMHRALLVAI
jgi:diacylglycerol kinase family enzyme